MPTAGFFLRRLSRDFLFLGGGDSDLFTVLFPFFVLLLLSFPKFISSRITSASSTVNWPCFTIAAMFRSVVFCLFITFLLRSSLRVLCFALSCSSYSSISLSPCAFVIMPCFTKSNTSFFFWSWVVHDRNLDADELIVSSPRSVDNSSVVIRDKVVPSSESFGTMFTRLTDTSLLSLFTSSPSLDFSSTSPSDKPTDGLSLILHSNNGR